MKKLLVIAGILFTLSNAGIGIAYACECYVGNPPVLVCTGKICTGDGQTCSCSGNESDVAESGGGN